MMDKYGVDMQALTQTTPAISGLSPQTQRRYAASATTIITPCARLTPKGSSTSACSLCKTCLPP